MKTKSLVIPPGVQAHSYTLSEEEITPKALIEALSKVPGNHPIVLDHNNRLIEPVSVTIEPGRYIGKDVVYLVIEHERKHSR